MENKIAAEVSRSLLSSNASVGACDHSELQSVEAVKSRAEKEKVDLCKSKTGLVQMLVITEFSFLWLKACLQPEHYTKCGSMDLAHRANEDFSRISRYLKKVGQARRGR